MDFGVMQFIIFAVILVVAFAVGTFILQITMGIIFTFMMIVGYACQWTWGLITGKDNSDD